MGKMEYLVRRCERKQIDMVHALWRQVELETWWQWGTDEYEGPEKTLKSGGHAAARAQTDLSGYLRPWWCPSLDFHWVHGPAAVMVCVDVYGLSYHQITCSRLRSGLPSETMDVWGHATARDHTYLNDIHSHATSGGHGPCLGPWSYGNQVLCWYLRPMFPQKAMWMPVVWIATWGHVDTQILGKPCWADPTPYQPPHLG